MRERVAGVVLAAGQSARMGVNKLLLDAGGEPVVRRTVRRALDAGLDPVLVVVGHEAERVRDALHGLRHVPVANPDHAAGVNGSVTRGIAAVPPECDAAVVLLGDMPFVTSAMVRAVVAAFHDTGTPLVVSEYGGVTAPPTLYARALFGEFTATDGEGCGKRIVRRHRADAAVLRWPEDALADLDRPEDYAALTARLAEVTD